MPVVLGDAGALEQALRAAQRGDRAAFNSLVLTFQRQIYNVCFRTLGSAEDAADATQDTFLSAFRGLSTFKGPAPGLRPWMLRVAVNTCYDHLRRRQRRPSESLDALDEVDAEGVAHGDRVVDPDPGPEQHLLSAEVARAIQFALDRLSDEHRLTVVLCDVQGFSYEEAASAMSVELGTVKSRLSRARAQLRDLLAAAGELPAGARRLERKNP
jgi:RNA polymerase sigma-70 factor (ECF subfamily)